MKRYSMLLTVTVVSLIAFSSELRSQDGMSPVTLSGYVSNMQSWIFEKPDENWINDNLIHNRLNFRLYAGKNLSFGLEMRNRVFTGDMLRQSPGYADHIGTDQGMIDMSWNIINENSVLFNVTADRAWLDLSYNKFQITVGRQRINWGQTFVWNPNDIFNVYSYFDFDYVERPGSDAVRIQMFPSYSSAIELAAKYDSDDNLTVAALTRFTLGGYDVQLLGGYVNSEDMMLGTGWSGSLGSTSFRGEISWFQPSANFADSSGTGLFTLGLDRSFSNNSMIQAQAMYCNSPVQFENFDSFYSGNLSAKDLAFSKFSLFSSVTYPVTPLVNLSLSAIWYAGIDGFFAGPSADISLSENIDFSFLWQHFTADMSDQRMTMNLAFLRVKMSF